MPDDPPTRVTGGLARPGATAFYTTGPEYVDRVVDAYVREVVLAPRRVAVQALVAVVVFVAGVVLGGGGTTGVLVGLVYVGSSRAWSRGRCGASAPGSLAGWPARSPSGRRSGPPSCRPGSGSRGPS